MQSANSSLPHKYAPTPIPTLPMPPSSLFMVTLMEEKPSAASSSEVSPTMPTGPPCHNSMTRNTPGTTPPHPANPPATAANAAAAMPSTPTTRGTNALAGMIVFTAALANTAIGSVPSPTPSAKTSNFVLSPTTTAMSVPTPVPTTN